MAEVFDGSGAVHALVQGLASLWMTGGAFPSPPCGPDAFNSLTSTCININTNTSERVMTECLFQATVLRTSSEHMR